MQTQFVIITSNKFEEWTAIHRKYLKDSALILGDEYGGDDLESNVPKFFSGVVMAEADWSVHLDHNGFLHPQLLDKWVATKPKPGIYATAVWGCWPGDPTLVYPSGGCIIMDWSTREKLRRHIFSQPHTIFGDVTLGLTIKKLGIAFSEVGMPSYHHYVNSPTFLEKLYQSYLA